MDSETDYEKYENRLKTFASWPRESVVFIKDLVEAGFSYSGNGDLVVCCCCYLSISNWKDNEEPLKRHEAENSSCPYLAHRRKLLEAGPMLSGHTAARAASAAHSTSSSGNGEASGMPKMSTGLAQASCTSPSHTPEKTVVQQFGTHVVTTHQREYGSKPTVVFVENSTVDINENLMSVKQKQDRQTVKQTADFPKLIIPKQKNYSFPNAQHVSPSVQQQRSPRSLETAEISPQSVFTTFPAPRATMFQRTDPSSTHTHQGSSRITISEIGEEYPVREYTLASPSQTMRFQQPLRATDMSSQNARLRTFLTWPQDVAVQPIALAEAGFYYLGNNDGVRCYECGIALRNWEHDDVPWVEHAKWSPTCPLVEEHEGSKNMLSETNLGHLPNVQMARAIRPNMLSSASYALPAINIPSRSPRYSPVTEATLDINSGFHIMGTGNVIIDEQRNSQNLSSRERSNSETFGQRHHSRESSSDLEIQGSLPDLDIDNLLDAGFTLTTISEVQKLCFQENQAYCDSVEAMADAIMYFLDKGSLEGYSLTPTSPIHAPKQSLDENNQSKPLDAVGSANIQDQKNEEQSDLKKELDRVKEMQICKICMDEQVGVVFLPCGHLIACPSCSTGMQQCPLCRATIVSSSRIYF